MSETKAQVVEERNRLKAQVAKEIAISIGWMERAGDAEALVEKKADEFERRAGEVRLQENRAVEAEDKCRDLTTRAEAAETAVQLKRDENRQRHKEVLDYIDEVSHERNRAKEAEKQLAAQKTETAKYKSRCSGMMLLASAHGGGLVPK